MPLSKIEPASLDTILFATTANTFGVTANANTFSNTIIIVSGNTEPINVGMLVTGSNIAPGTTVISFDTPPSGRSNIRLSQAASGSNTNTAVSFYEANKVLSPGIAAPGMAKAWVNFNGATATMQIRAAYNVSSITDNGTGDYTVNFITAMPDANYAVFGLSNSVALGGANRIVAEQPNGLTLRSTTQIRVGVGVGGVADLIDELYVSVAIFR